ncbi:hypothetical protein LCGC14_2423480 [marine sediment metagenome]|uniref:Uncharacterized protein n=1 Tax=marine sediment metagenome TaxID=412755 RepID=A0A0F9EI47_9ZZZZ
MPQFFIASIVISSSDQIQAGVIQMSDIDPNAGLTQGQLNLVGVVTDIVPNNAAALDIGSALKPFATIFVNAIEGDALALILAGL